VEKEWNEKSADFRNLTIPIFGYEIIRDELLEDLLGKDAPDILYWAGKRLARKYPLFSIEEVKEFFQNAGWGILEAGGQKKEEMEFFLSGPIVKYRLETHTEPTFRLEAGFLAEQLQLQKKVYAECFEQLEKEKGIIRFIARWDREPLD
jgi:Protein of unknown function (DUF2507).